MPSRMDKYSGQHSYSRTKKNASLYKEVYGSYAGLENLPIADNINEIDMKDLERLVKQSNMTNTKEKKITDTFEDITNKTREQRVYDINKILEKAKSDNIKEVHIPKNKVNNYEFLTNSNNDIKVNNVRKENLTDINKKIIEDTNYDDKIYMTRELKFKNISEEVNKEIDKTKELSPLDLFEDLKPDGNTIITEPIEEEKDNILTTKETKKIKNNKEVEIKKIANDDDIDIINEKTKEILMHTRELKKINKEDSIDDDFYTNSYKFSKKDFLSDDDEEEDNKSGGTIIKVFFLLLAIFALVVLIYYFVSKYGIGV